MPKKRDVHREEKYEKATIHRKYTELQNTRIHRILFWISEMLLKIIFVYLFLVGGVSSVSVYRKTFISFGIEGHTFGPTNVREHFPEEELTLGQWFLTGGGQEISRGARTLTCSTT